MAKGEDWEWVKWVERMFDGFNNDQCQYLKERLDARLKNGKAILVASKPAKPPEDTAPLTHDPISVFMENLDSVDKLDGAMKKFNLDIDVRKYPSFGMAKMQAKTKIKGALKRGELTESQLLGE